jgi:hypothetical protein
MGRFVLTLAPLDGSLRLRAPRLDSVHARHRRCVGDVGGHAYWRRGFRSRERFPTRVGRSGSS